MKKEILEDFFEKHIRGTCEKAVVIDQKMLLCRMTVAVSDGIEMKDNMRSIYITTRCLKHLYDKKPAEEFLFIVKHLYQITRYPSRIYKNKKSKRGEFCFVKKIGSFEYFCSLEITNLPTELGISKLGEERMEVQIVTAFRLRSDKYIKNYTLLWDWGTGNPHRSALDTPEESTSAPQ